MTGHHNFENLIKDWPPEWLEEVKEATRQSSADMLLIELKKLTGRTQEELAAHLGVKEPDYNRLDEYDDLQVSLFRRIVELLGGELKITLMKDGSEILLVGFEDKDPDRERLRKKYGKSTLEVRQEPEQE